MMFWIVTTGMALAVAALLARAIVKGRAEAVPTEVFDLQVYRDQLKEIEREAARGVIPAEEAERLRTEVSRRILSADAKAQKAQTVAVKGGGGLGPALAVTAFVLVGGFGVYTQLGAPGYPDLPLKGRIEAAKEARENRPSQAEAEAGMPPAPTAEAPGEYLELVKRLRAAVEERPDDLQGQILLARSEAALGNYVEAQQALARIAALKGAEATAQDYADLADMMVIAAGGYVSPEAQQAIEDALARDPQNGVARYYGGLMMAQTGRPDVGFRMWDNLLRESPPDAAWVAPMRAQIEDMAFRAGVSDYQLPEIAAPRGPSQADMAAAADMTDEERQDMIRGMVSQLSDRLASEGGPPQDWARLISSLGILGDTDQARAIWTEAQAVFADQPEALQALRAAAQRAGVAE
ncbi:c-type cytochrome biogenesis protein CcmI [Tropicibacter oceani]|uniref:C-type cytochrome biogenesis protein CcmI n=1 Tax=Tropicibacter oceani TaxID=3058420 RepID=A0ABY8QCR5_9RHOB|nr:c-type cytochrome biogenesis protein CcmI [Tropicibacter oceani]WGW02419.1 c-type cytochrome biogenesis protein CcmI [Tropicibacter oceani]